MADNDDFMDNFNSDDDLDSIAGKSAEELEQENEQADKPIEEAPKDEPNLEEQPKDDPEPEKPADPVPDPDPDPDTLPAEEQPKAPEPLTRDDIRNLVEEIRYEERNAGKDLEAREQDILNTYYPEGLSETLIDKNTGREIKTPADVVELSGDTMTTEEASQWLDNEKYRLRQENDQIKQSARQLAETNLNFERGSKAVLQKNAPLFDKYPQLQSKVYNRFMKLVKYDPEKEVILSAPDIEEFYDDYLEPYRLAFEHSQQQSATAPVEQEKPAEPPKPTAEDRLDLGGDGGAGGGDGEADPNDPMDSLNKLFGE